VDADTRANKLTTGNNQFLATHHYALQKGRDMKIIYELDDLFECLRSGDSAYFRAGGLYRVEIEFNGKVELRSDVGSLRSLGFKEITNTKNATHFKYIGKVAIGEVHREGES